MYYKKHFQKQWQKKKILALNFNKFLGKSFGQYFLTDFKHRENSATHRLFHFTGRILAGLYEICYPQENITYLFFHCE